MNKHSSGGVIMPISPKENEAKENKLESNFESIRRPMTSG